METSTEEQKVLSGFDPFDVYHYKNIHNSTTLRTLKDIRLKKKRKHY